MYELLIAIGKFGEIGDKPLFTIELCSWGSYHMFAYAC